MSHKSSEDLNSLQSYIENDPTVEFREKSHTTVKFGLLQDTAQSFFASLPDPLRHGYNYQVEFHTLTDDAPVIRAREAQNLSNDAIPIASLSLPEIKTHLDSLQDDMHTYAVQISRSNQSIPNDIRPGSFVYTIDDDQFTVEIPTFSESYHLLDIFPLLRENAGIGNITKQYIEYIFTQPIVESDTELDESQYTNMWSVRGNSLKLNCRDCSEDTVLTEPRRGGPRMFICKNCHSGWIIPSNKEDAFKTDTYDSVGEFQRTYMDKPAFDDILKFGVTDTKTSDSIHGELSSQFGEITQEFFVTETIENTPEVQHDETDNREYSIALTTNDSLLLGIYYPTYTQYIRYEDWESPQEATKHETSNCSLCGTVFPYRSDVISTKQCIVPRSFPDHRLTGPYESICLECHNEIYPKFLQLYERYSDVIMSHFI